MTQKQKKTPNKRRLFAALRRARKMQLPTTWEQLKDSTEQTEYAKLCAVSLLGRSAITLHSYWRITDIITIYERRMYQSAEQHCGKLSDWFLSDQSAETREEERTRAPLD